MSDTTKLVKRLHDLVNRSQMSKKFEKATCVAMICGPSVVIETIVKTAEKESGIEMDWCYFGGRGLVHPSVPESQY